ncbi:hypothetical protein BDF20DRAFT_860916 [Mycotypha africana]|uniref:uncharacterized protein n=1 Tax=Mycotypha africana TaxID=64632 RepID=UPI0023018A91|nr:uncharacterized protein BDF20DRAFT_860916 [Mycotypha africana]KAI8984621.1 hypothetical protein BDF20DRAFT_860916 [Mycotypha africana]
MAFSPKEFRHFRLDKIERVNHNVNLFRFSLPNETDVAGLPVASCVMFRANVEKEDGQLEEVIRPYTPVNLEEERGFVEFMIKYYPKGNMSKHVHNLKVGDTLEIKGPFEKYNWDQKTVQHVGMLAGGTGITPMLQLLRKNLNPKAKDQTSHWTLIFANITEEDIILKKELDRLAKEYPHRFKVHYVLERPPATEDEGASKYHAGYISAELLEKTMPKPDVESSIIFVCGPPPFMEAMSGDKNPDKSQGELRGYLKDLGYTSERVYKL